MPTNNSLPANKLNIYQQNKDQFSNLLENEVSNKVGIDQENFINNKENLIVSEDNLIKIPQVPNLTMNRKKNDNTNVSKVRFHN